MPTDRTRPDGEDADAALQEELLKPARQRQIFRVGDVAADLARRPLRLERDWEEYRRIKDDLWNWFVFGEFAEDEVLGLRDQPPYFVPFKPALDQALRQAKQEGKTLQFCWGKALLTRPALEKYLPRCGLEGAPRVLRELCDADVSPIHRRRRDVARKRPSGAELDAWMKENYKRGAKRDPTLRACREETGATVRQATAAFQRLPQDDRLKPGQKKLPVKNKH